jgi:hypothetical protein
MWSLQFDAHIVQYAAEAVFCVLDTTLTLFGASFVYSSTGIAGNAGWLAGWLTDYLDVCRPSRLASRLPKHLLDCLTRRLSNQLSTT